MIDIAVKRLRTFHFREAQSMLTKNAFLNDSTLERSSFDLACLRTVKWLKIGRGSVKAREEILQT